MRKPEPRTSSGGVTTYKIRFRLSGKQTSETFDTKREAEQFAKWLDALGPQGALDKLYTGEQVSTVPTLDEVAADHIRHLTGIEDGTRLNYERLWKRSWGQRIGAMPANRISSDLVKLTVNDLSTVYSAKSLKNQRGLLSAVLQRAVEQGHLPANPAKGVRLPRGKEHERAEMRILAAVEFTDVLERITPHYRPLVMFLYGTGCRWGEAVALTIGDLALPNVRIRRALKWSPDNNRTVGATKTRKSNRTLLLPDPVIEVIRPLLDRPLSAAVFTAPKGGPVHHRTFWSDIWCPAVQHLTPRPRIHDLRHSHASILLGAGVPIHVVQARLGHESIQTTVDTYSHMLPDAQLQAARATELAFQPRELGSR